MLFLKRTDYSTIKKLLCLFCWEITSAIRRWEATLPRLVATSSSFVTIKWISHKYTADDPLLAVCGIHFIQKMERPLILENETSTGFPLQKCDVHLFLTKRIQKNLSKTIF